MFEPHFGLRENPFSTGHDSRFVYPSPEHLEAVAHFRYGIQNREAFVLVTGEVGTGKTTAIYDLVSRLPQTTHVALINNSALTRLELLEEIARRFGVEPPSQPSKPALLAALEHRLALHVGHAEPCILIVDEAQNLSHELLEEVRLLSNLEDRGGRLLHICLVGQPELEEKLARPELRQLRQRISVKYRLNPLSVEECTRYIHHRLRVAGGEPERIFPEDSCQAVHRLTNGIPREINIVASQSMVNAYVAGTRPVRPEHVHSVSEDFSFQSVLGGTGPIPAPPPLHGFPTPPPPAAGALAGRPAVAPVPAAPAPPPPAAAPVMPAWGATPRVPVATTHASPHAPVEPVMPLPRPAAATAPPPPAPPAPAIPEPPRPAPAAATPSLPPPPPTPQPAAAAFERSISNWRERRPAPVAIPTGTPEAAAVAHAAAEYAAVDAGESMRAKRTRLVAIAAVIAAIAIGAVVVYSTGVGALLAGKRDPAPTVATPGAVPGEAQVAGPAANGSAAATPTSSAPAAIKPGPAFGIQVASFRTAGRATRVLHDYVETTGLPGEVLTSAADGDDPWYRIVIGRFATEAEARTRGDELLNKSVIAEAIVLPYTPRQP